MAPVLLSTEGYCITVIAVILVGVIAAGSDGSNGTVTRRQVSWGNPT